MAQRLSADPSVSADPGQRAPTAPRMFSGMFDSFKIRNFRIFMIANMAQMAPMSMQMVAAGWFTYKLTGSSGLLGVSMLAGALPMLTLGPFGGFIADRFSRKGVSIAGAVALMLVTLWQAVFISLGWITWQHLAIGNFIQSGIFALTMPARNAVIPEIVGRENVTNAAGLNMAGMNVNQIAMPALAGFLLATIGVGFVFYLMAAMFVVSAVLTLFLPPLIAKGAAGRERLGMFASMREGFSYVAGHRILRSVLAFTFLMIMLGMPFQVLLPVFTTDVLKVGPGKLGLLMSISGFGALAASLIIAGMGNRKRGLVFLTAGLIAGFGMLVFALSSSFVICLAIMIPLGTAQAFRMALGGTLIQSVAEDRYLGRVMSLFMMQFGVTSLGAFGVSIIAELFGVRAAYITISVACIAVAATFNLFSPALRRLD